MNTQDEASDGLRDYCAGDYASFSVAGE